MKDTGSRNRKWEKSQWKSKIGCGTGTGMVRREEHCVGRMTMEMRKRGRPKIRWLDRASGDIKENGVSGRE